MPNETIEFQDGAQTYRIQYDIVAPPPTPPKRPGEIKAYAPKPQFQVAAIRITEVTEGVGEDGPKKNIQFARGFDTLAQARTGASEYAKRIVREQMRPKPPEPAPAG